MNKSIKLKILFFAFISILFITFFIFYFGFNDRKVYKEVKNCPYNEYLLTYKKGINPDKTFEQAIKDKETFEKAINDLTYDCAKNLVGRNSITDVYIFSSGFPSIESSLSNDYKLISLAELFYTGNRKYFHKDIENNLKFLRKYADDDLKIAALGGEVSARLVYDFVLGIRYDSDVTVKTDEIMNTAKQAFNAQDFVLYLPVWQGKLRRQQFKELCFKLGCDPQVIAKCDFSDPSIKKNLFGDALSYKNIFITNNGNIEKTRKYCGIKTINGSGYSYESTQDGIFRFKRLGLFNENCLPQDTNEQLKYLYTNGFKDLPNCNSAAIKGSSQ